MEGKKKKELRLREMPIDVYQIVLDEQHKQRREKGHLVALDRVIYCLIREYKKLNLELK